MAVSGISVEGRWPERLRALRERLHLTQAELAAKLGVHTTTVERWEAGMLPRPEKRRAIERLERRAAR